MSQTNYVMQNGRVVPTGIDFLAGLGETGKSFIGSAAVYLGYYYAEQFRYSEGDWYAGVLERKDETHTRISEQFRFLAIVDVTECSYVVVGIPEFPDLLDFYKLVQPMWSVYADKRLHRTD